MTPEIKQRIEQIRRGEVPERYVKTALGLAPANWKRYTFGDIYTERREPGDENLPLLMVSIHSGVKKIVVNGQNYTEKMKSDLKEIIDLGKSPEEICEATLSYFAMCRWQ